MAHITYIESDGRSKTVDVPTGWSLMQGAVEMSHRHRRRVRRLDGVRDLPLLRRRGAVFRTAPARGGRARHADMAASEVKPNSRLSCQLKASPAIEGLTVHLPETRAKEG